MAKKIYRFLGVEVALQMLRPDATWEFYNGRIVKWNDPRPCPTQQEINETLEKIKAFEDSINTIWTDDQLNQMRLHEEKIREAI